MPQQTTTAVEQNFTKGLITEATGLNFPENACTQTQNCIFTLIGDVTRREGFDYEINSNPTPASLFMTNRANQAISYYMWTNVGGDGQTQIVVQQIGFNLYFWRSSTATTSVPLSRQLIGTLAIASYSPAGEAFDVTKECQFSDGNGYLFVYHPTIDPVYVTYVNGSLTANPIIIQIRDQIGVTDNLAITTRPATLSAEHQYNLINQGWVAGSPWTAASSTTITVALGTQVFTVPAGIVGISNGQQIRVDYTGSPVFNSATNSFVVTGEGEMSGTVTGYTGTTLTVNINNLNTPAAGAVLSSHLISALNIGYINTWFTAEGNYPSNADVWWYYKDNTGTFNPASLANSVSLSSGQAPQGHFIFSLFNQNRSTISTINGLTPISTFARPSTGAWFQGRIWYTGVNATFPATGDVAAYSWTESIYFSQIVSTPADFGSCYQTNDPTSEELFNELPTDGGVIQIQGAGAIYKLFPLLNALLVFAANGVWYISGGSSVGFSATDYTIVKLSAVKCLSSTSFVDVNGLPIFWNEEGIYQVEPAKQGTQLLNSPLHVQPLTVEPLTVGTILTYYNNIPLQSKKYARGAYSPIDYVVQWCYKSVNETGVTDRYTYDTILNFNTSNKAFYPYSFNISSPTTPAINGMVYVSSPGGTGAPNSVFKYGVSAAQGNTYVILFADEHDTTYVDWTSQGTPTNYVSDFVTGYKIRGQGIKRFQPQFVNIFSRTNSVPFGYTLQAIWDYANNQNSNRWSTIRYVNVDTINYDVYVNRHKLRGRGYSIQFKVSSIQGQPFDIQGWSVIDNTNAGA